MKLRIPVTVQVYALKAKQAIRYLAETLATGPCLIGRHKSTLEPTQTACGRTFVGFEYCPRCCMTRELTEPTVEHPESLDNLLSAAQEAWLAELDAALWPDETDWELTRDAAQRLARSTED